MLQVRSIAMAVWRGSTATVTTAGASMGTGCRGITSTGTVATRGTMGISGDKKRQDKT